MGDKLISTYEILLDHYGDLNWWPAKTPYEVIVGAVLTQNTAWSNVEKAIANFGMSLTPEAVANADIAELKEIIRPADSILLYAFGFPTFVVDAYTDRLCERYPIDAGNGYAAVRAYFENNIPQVFCYVGELEQRDSKGTIFPLSSCALPC